jgi:antitoxin CptB
MAARDIERLRWRCRRGLLELDLILAQFVERELPELNAENQQALGALLTCSDNDLLDIVMGRQACPNAQWLPVVELLQRA